MAAKKKPANASKRAKKRLIKDAVLKMLVKGATLDQLMRQLEWQKHSVRGLISNLGKAGAQIESFKAEGTGERSYRLAS